MKSATLVSRIPTSNSSARQYPKIAPRPSTSHAQNVGYIISGATFGPNTQFVDANGNPVMFVQAGSSDETIVTHSYTQPVQYPSSSHAYSSASTSQHEFNEFVRSCPECKEKFPTLKALKSHIDKCLITSFENEVINTMTSLPNLQLEGDYDSSFIHRPLLEDEMGSPELATMEPIRQEHRYDTEPTDIFDDFPELESNFNDIDDALESQTSGSPADFDLKPSPKRLAQIRKRKLAEDIKLSQLNGFRDRINDDILLVENTQTVESRKGLKLLVSVKRPKIIKSEQIPGPSSSMEQEEDDELDILQRPSTSKNEDLLETGVNRTRYKVIGALANADTTANDVKMECPTCGLRLYKHNFSAHYRIHTGDLPYDCKYCDKKFRTTSAQKVHMRCHTGEKPYQCPKCPYACITKRNLDRHIINNHVRKNADGTTNQPRFRKSKYYRPETDFRIETGQEEPEEYFVMYDANNFNEALEAVENNDLRKLKRILNHYLVRAQDQEGTSILRYAVMKGRQDIVNYLLESYGDSLRDQIEEIPAKE